MSLLSSFLASHLIPALEQAIIDHEPEVQEALLAEMRALSEQVAKWLDSKLSPKAE